MDLAACYDYVPQKAAIPRYLRILMRWKLSTDQWEELADRAVMRLPRSRNEDLAALMRRMNFWEERGSGIDKVVFYSEVFQLPAPSFEVRGISTVATLYAHKKFGDMDKGERTRACNLHCCLKYVSGKHMTNSSLRTRFQIRHENAAMALRVISETIKEGLIKPKDPSSGSRMRAGYVPFWA